jgi:hypothetical protein
VSVQAEVSPVVQSKQKGMLHCVQYDRDAMLGRFYAICNCCSCCCGAMNAWSHGTPMLASSGYVARVDQDQRTACAVCAEFCPIGPISVDDGFALMLGSAWVVACALPNAHRKLSPSRASQTEGNRWRSAN